VFLAALSQGLGGAPAVLAVGAQPLAAPFLGGTLLLQPVFFMAQALDGPAGAAGQGETAFALPVPDDPALSGASVFLQGFVLDGGAGQLGALSAGLMVIVG
jgi:hypothetical protein